MLTVRVSISPSMDTRSRSVACSRLASASASAAAIGADRDDDELVAAEAGDQVGAVGASSQPLGEDADEPVAGVVAEVVVDGLEPVEVEEQRGDRARLPGANRSSRWAIRARRLCRPVRSSCSAR